MKPCKDQDYFDLISNTDQHVVVLVGESHDQWTLLAEAELKKADVPFEFFSWSELREARVSGEWVRFPVLQLWTEGDLESEIIGFSQEKYRKFAHQYAKI